MTSPTNEQQRVDVLAVMDCMNDLIRGEFIGPDDLDLTDEGLIEKGQQVRAAVAELIEAHKSSVDEIERLRDAMFRVYAVAANGGDTAPAIELMRDEMDKPWSVDRSRAALTNVGSQP